MLLTLVFKGSDTHIHTDKLTWSHDLIPELFIRDVSFTEFILLAGRPKPLTS